VNKLLAPFFELRPTDAIDILLVTGLLYAAIVWFRRSRASLVAIGVIVFAGIYTLARVFELQLTTWIFQGIFAVLLLILVVIFQEELRQVFESLALWGLRRTAVASTSQQTADIIVEALANLSRQRVGALIVIPGNQPLGRHVRGGVDLGGRVSIPLLESLFDPHSPGHDGAAILVGDRVTRFGVHLPLSSDATQLAGVGTRHSAALGLANRTDALCLVVSEERGHISVARGAQLRRLEDARDLARFLVNLRARPAASRAPRFLRRIKRLHWPELIGAFASVLALWLVLVPGSRPSKISLAARVVVTNLPPGYEVESIDPSTVDVGLRGPARAFYLFDPATVEVVVDATLARLGRRTYRVSGEQVRRPAGMEVEDVRPAQIRLSLEKETE